MNISQDANLKIKNIRAQQIKHYVTKKSFTNLLFVSIAEKLAYFFNPFIDTVIIGIFLSVEIQAAIGFFMPVITIISLVWVIIMGVQILCAQYRGHGDNEKFRTLFDSAILFLGAIAVIASVGLFFGRAMVATVLGAQGQSALVL